VILNESPGGYQQILQNQIMDLIYARSGASLLDKSGGIFVRNGEHLSAEDKQLLMSVACLYLDDRAGGLSEQLNQRIHTLTPPTRRFIAHAAAQRNQHVDWTPDSVSYATSTATEAFQRMGGSIRLSSAKTSRRQRPGQMYWLIPVLAALSRRRDKPTAGMRMRMSTG
jgi:hypothetical protein